MGASRLDTLAGIVKQNPGNLLARYGLAMEYAQQGQHEKAVEQFRAIISSHPNYVAAYYQGGRVLHSIGQVQQAREIYEQGLAACDRAGDLHTKSEIEAALADLG